MAERDRENRGVSPRSTEAQNFCGFGALTRAAEERGLYGGGHAAVLAFLAAREHDLTDDRPPRSPLINPA